jgi:hypothetical protein
MPKIMKNQKEIYLLLCRLALLGNILFILWPTYHGLKERFSGTLVEKVSYIALIILLGLNIMLILRFLRENKKHLE